MVEARPPRLCILARQSHFSSFFSLLPIFPQCILGGLEKSSSQLLITKVTLRNKAVLPPFAEGAPQLKITRLSVSERRLSSGSWTVKHLEF